MEIIYSRHFFREYKKLPFRIKDLAEKKEAVFRDDPFHYSLKTHKLKGRFDGFWAFSIDFKNRVIFEFGDNGKIYFLSIGDHGIYD